MSQSDKEDNERSFPSSIPQRSPSPDYKNRNKIVKTVSPTLQVRKQMTSGIRQSRGYNTLPTDENDDFGIHEFDKSYETSDMKRLKERLYEQDRLIMHLTSKSGGDLKSSRIYEDLKQRLLQKDKTINDLKKVIATLSEKSQISESRSENQRIRALEIQNERLGEIVKKLNKKETQDKKEIQQKLMHEILSLEDKIQKLALHNKELEEKLTWTKKDLDFENHEKETLRRQVSELMGLEERNNSLEIENQRLLKLLTDKKQTLPEITISQQNQIFRLQGEIKVLKEKSAPEKMTLQKIREQYNESIKLFKVQVQHQIQLQFQKMQQVISGLKIKLTRIQSQIPRIQQLQREVMQSPIKLAQLSKSYVQETADLTSQIKKQRQQKRLIQDKFDQLQKNYDKLIKNKEDEARQSIEKMKQSVVDLEDIRKEADLDRRKHHEELQIVKNAYETDIQRLKNKHNEEIDEFKATTKYQIDQVVLNYNKQIQVLKGNLNTRETEIYRFQQDLLNKEVEYRRNLQILEETVRKETNETARLLNQLKQKQSFIRSLKQNKQEIEELGEVRKRSQTELQYRYNEVESKYSELLSNHAETSTRYTQLLTKYNTSCEEIQRQQNQILQIEEKNRILTLENEMIPELKNRITKLEEQLLDVEQKLQEQKIENQNLEGDLSRTRAQKTSAQKEIQGIKSKLTNFGSKSKTTIQTISRLETETSHSNKEFLRMVDQITNRIVKLEQENILLKKLVDVEKVQVQSLTKNLLKVQKSNIQSQFQVQQLKNQLSGLSKKLLLKERELQELRLLLQTKINQESVVVSEQYPDSVNLEDIENLKREFQRVVGSFSSQIVAIKRTVVETSDIYTSQ